MTEIITDYLNAKQLADRLTALELNSTSELARLEQERDEALSQIVQAECRAERFCQERDEARTDLEFRRGLYKVQEQQLETARRKRDEAVEALKHIEEYGTEEINAAVELRQKLASTLVERDEAREEAHRFRSLSYARSGIDKSASWFPWETSLNLAQKAQLLATEKHAK